eukprot:1025545-Pyramimonas_sp.AAC.1
MRRLRGIRTDFVYLFWNFREIARAVHKAGGAVCLEWPIQCNYWRDPQVKEFMREPEFVKTALHGCAYGLRDIVGNFMKKPWTIASTSHDVTEGLERKCDGTHEHVEARGRESKSAEDYTDAFAKQ